MTSPRRTSTRPRFTAIVAVYNVSDYIDEFFASLDRQTSGLSEVEIILVDDGSPDDSGAKADAWARTHPTARVIHKENGGAASARNAGLAVATGEWVTFPDPDDVLADDYFEKVSAFLDAHAHEEPDLLSTRTLFLLEAEGGRLWDNYPLKRKFKRGDRVTSLIDEPTAFQLQGATALMRLDRLREFDLSFDVRVRPNFEDAHLVTRYLLTTPEPRVGLVRSAAYHYRRRENGSSLVQTSWTREEKYTDLLRYGYLDVLEQAAARYGSVPKWLQNVVLYDLGWFFKTDQGNNAPTASLPETVLTTFHELVARILSHIARDTIDDFAIYGIPDDMRFIIGNAYRNAGAVHGPVRAVKRDLAAGLVQLRYDYLGDAPHEELMTDRGVIEPAFAKTRTLDYFGRTVGHERVMWVPAQTTVRVILNGNVAFTITPAFLDPAASLKKLAPTPYERAQARNAEPKPATASTSTRLSRLKGRFIFYWQELHLDRLRLRALRHYVSHPAVKRRYEKSWLFMDRDTMAGDNAEHLYRWVAREHPEHEPWFILRDTSPDWARLKREGFRLVKYGSFRWHALHLHAEQFASSHADDYVVNPLRNAGIGKPHWRFTFLQHGITKDDLSRWLNGKPFSLLITATGPEHDSIAGDDNPYVFTAKEAVLTGFPRHDVLLEKRRRVPEPERRLLVVMPTWRKTITGETVGRGNDRKKNPNFNSTEYAREYGALLRSPRLAEVARERGLEIVFMPHPNMEPYLPEFDLPSYVRTARYSDTDVQDILARSALVISDYSSIAFEAAFLDVPVVYFQFDAEEFFSGSHIGRRGYYSYEDDGFGPVCSTLEEVEAAVAATARVGAVPPSPYLERNAATFRFRDTNSRQRVYEAMHALTRRR